MSDNISIPATHLEEDERKLNRDLNIKSSLQGENSYMLFLINESTKVSREEQVQLPVFLKMLMQKKDEFMNIASHELKTPITSLKASLQIVNRIALQENNNNPVIKEFLARANKQADKLSLLIGDLLDVTKIQAGKIALNKTRINISEILKECAAQVQAMENTHSIQVDAEPELFAFADKCRIEQVIINLLSNAIKYSPDADKVILTAKGDIGKVRVEVKDFGIGIPEDKIHFLFSRFFKIQESSQGLGLGLYISSEMIKRHEGSVGVESSEGNGALFWFELPKI